MESTPRKISAIKRSVQIATLIQKDIPEVADDYRQIMFLSEIVSKHEIDIRYRTVEYDSEGRIIRQALDTALIGHRGGFGFGPFPGLIEDEDEQEKLAKAHRSRCGHETADFLYMNGRGIHGRSFRQMIEDSKNAVIAKGLVLWGPEEMSSAYYLAQKPEYKFTRELNGNKVNVALLTKTLNDIYHSGEQVRTVKSVARMLYDLKKVQENSKAS